MNDCSDMPCSQADHGRHVAPWGWLLSSVKHFLRPSSSQIAMIRTGSSSLHLSSSMSRCSDQYVHMIASKAHANTRADRKTWPWPLMTLSARPIWQGRSRMQTHEASRLCRLTSRARGVAWFGWCRTTRDPYSTASNGAREDNCKEIVWWEVQTAETGRHVIITCF